MKVERNLHFPLSPYRFVCMKILNKCYRSNVANLLLKRALDKHILKTDNVYLENDRGYLV